MNKITINKAFEKYFDQIIWKIEVDSVHRLIGVETRDAETTLPSFHLLDFEGHRLGKAFSPAEKEWTMDSVQNRMLILKRVGDSTPVKEGVRIVGFSAARENLEEIWTSYEYVLVDVYNGYVGMRHRAVSHGEIVFFCLETKQVMSRLERKSLVPPSNRISFPVSYPAHPPFLDGYGVEGQLWLNRIDEHYIWSYHVKRDGLYDLVLASSNRSQLFSLQLILSGMDKMVPQPYFQIERQLFFLSYNKQEIVSYLV